MQEEEAKEDEAQRSGRMRRNGGCWRCRPDSGGGVAADEVVRGEGRPTEEALGGEMLEGAAARVCGKCYGMGQTMQEEEEKGEEAQRRRCNGECARGAQRMLEGSTKLWAV